MRIVPASGKFVVSIRHEKVSKGGVILPEYVQQQVYICDIIEGGEADHWPSNTCLIESFNVLALGDNKYIVDQKHILGWVCE